MSRRLLRLYRQVMELRRNPHQEELRYKLYKGYNDMARRFEWPEATIDSIHNSHDVIEDTYKEEMATARSEGIKRWQRKMETSFAEQQKLVKKGVLNDLVNNKLKPGELVSPRWPAERVKEAEATWGQIWNRDQPADKIGWGYQSVQEHRRALEDLFMDFDRAETCPVVVIEAEDLRRTVATKKGRAAGPDGWRAEDWLQLPASWWTAVSGIWMAVLGGLGLPTTWTRVRVALIPKDDRVSDRPLAIAALIWRAGAAIVARETTQWAQAVFPPELQIGIAERGVHRCHGRILLDIQQALEEDGDLCMVAEDLAKCFDSVSPWQALAIGSEMGLHRSVVSLAGKFYQQCTKVHQGFHHRRRDVVPLGNLSRLWRRLARQALRLTIGWGSS